MKPRRFSKPTRFSLKHSNCLLNPIAVEILFVSHPERNLAGFKTYEVWAQAITKRLQRKAGQWKPKNE